MSNDRQLAAALRAAREHAGHTQDTAARLISVDPSTLRKWEQERIATPFSRIPEVEAAYDLPRGWILRRAGYCPDDARWSTRDAIASDPRLPDEARVSLAALYDALVTKGDDPAPPLDVLRTLGDE